MTSDYNRERREQNRRPALEELLHKSNFPTFLRHQKGREDLRGIHPKKGTGPKDYGY